MKVNVISDIHAAYNPKTNEVFYHLPFKYSHKQYIKFFNILYTNWLEDKASLKKLLKIHYTGLTLMYKETIVIHKISDIDSFLSELNEAVKSNFVGITKDRMFYFTRGLYNIDEIYSYSGHNPFFKKSKLTINDFRNFIFKTCYDFDPSKLESADYLIIAGDLGLDNYYDYVLKDIEEKTKGKFKKILHIAGNHDHWWCGLNGMNLKRPDTVNLDRDYCEYSDGEYLFLGCTLWTPIDDNAVWRIGRTMNDYAYTPGRFTPYASRQQYAIQSTWLRNKIKCNKDKKIIVFTHHQPFEELIAEDYKHNGKGWSGDDVNEAYVVTDHSLDDINRNKNIILWCCGHTHQCFDGMLHDVHVVRNPIGYSDLYGHCPAENISDTWYNKIIEV